MLFSGSKVCRQNFPIFPLNGGTGLKRNGQVIVAVNPLVVGFTLDMGRRGFDPDRIETGDNFFDECARQQPGVEGTEADMVSTAKGDVGVGSTVEFDHIRIAENTGVTIRRSPAERNPFVFSIGAPSNLRSLGKNATDVGDRRDHAEKLLGGEIEKLRTLAQGLERLGMLSEEGDDARDGMNDRVAAAGKRCSGSRAAPHG
jgi:hypothetical protein